MRDPPTPILQTKAQIAAQGLENVKFCPAPPTSPDFPHYANRVHTNLVAVVSEEERAKYPTLVSIQKDGEHTLTTNFERAIDDAERAREATATHRRQ